MIKMNYLKENWKQGKSFLEDQDYKKKLKFLNHFILMQLNKNK